MALFPVQTTQDGSPLCRNTSEEPNSGVEVVPQWIQIREQTAQTPSNFDNDCPSNLVVSSCASYLLLQQSSLIPRPFPPPVVDCLQYTNTEGEDLGDLVTCGYMRQVDRG